MFSQSPSISPTDQRKPALGNHRKVLAILGEDDYFALNPTPPTSSSASYQLSLNPIAHEPFPTTWTAQNGLPSSNSGTFFQDSSEHEVSPISAAFRSEGEPTTGSDVHDFGYKDYRRESLASADSGNSKSSQNVRSRIQGLFGGGVDGENASSEHSGREDSDVNIQAFPYPPSLRSRNDSTSSKPLPDPPRNRGVSPKPSRPRTPLPSSDVTPWMYQTYGVCTSLSIYSIPKYL